ncbi:hypothetical protein ACHAW6_006955 [Cyclotella cf. meneghiniana]
MRIHTITTSFLVRAILPHACSIVPPNPRVIACHAMSTSTPPSLSPTTHSLRVLSYNVLSSKLARPSHFTTTDPDHLDASNRLPLILTKLENEINRGFASSHGTEQTTASSSPPPPTIICLQEIDHTFTSALHVFFANRGYHFVTGLYGKKFNGYMGVGIAYPSNKFDTIRVDICRLSDEREEGWPRAPEEEEDSNAGPIQRVTRSVTKRLARFSSFALQRTSTLLHNYVGKHLGANYRLALGLSAPTTEPTIDPWGMSESRSNVLLTTVLKFRNDSALPSSNSSGVFSISNYHMPCAFYCPPVMNIHVDMAARRAQQLARKAWADIHGDEAMDCQEGATVPHILAGDFNILPESSHYKLITTGTLGESDVTYPPMKHGMKWNPTCRSMGSAYAMHSGGTEPSFTNYAHLKEEEEPFIGTLDYIFLSRKDGIARNNEDNGIGESWIVSDVVKLPERDVSGGPFPNACEPSDHLLIGADLELVSEPHQSVT